MSIPGANNLLIGEDINGTKCDTINISTQIYAVTLGSNSVTNITVPAGVDSAFFSYGSSGDVWVSLNGNAAIPGATFVATTSELNPVSRRVVPGQIISCICLFANPVQISFYNLRNT